MQTEIIEVDLADRAYAIHVGSGLLSSLGKLAAGLDLTGRAAIVTDENVARHYLPAVREALAAEGWEAAEKILPAGEQTKSREHLQELWGWFIAQGLERRSLVVALGGGVVGDLVGFAAATYLRGVPYAQVPTSLLAQVDSSVGGKTAINLPEGKNLVGAFYQPGVVVIDVDTLKTLETRHFAAGMGEVIKYGAAMDAELFAYLEENLEAARRRDPRVLGHLVRRCCELKRQVVLEDELDLGARAVLNYGHTLGHAVEVLAGYGAYYHGEAVAVGMAFAARVSVHEGLMTEAERGRLLRLLEAAGLDHAAPRFAPEQWRAALERDKKKRAGRVRMVLARGLGNAVLKDFQISDIITLIG